MFKFEKLSVWQRAVTLVDLIYQSTRTFPENERYGLTNQLCRAAVSVASNIAEGSARSDLDFARFVGIAPGSLYEVVTQITLAKRQGFLNQADFEKIYRDAEEISRMLSGLRSSLASNDASNPPSGSQP